MMVENKYINNYKGIIMKIKLIFLTISILAFSCDGDDDNNNVTLADIEGDWLPDSTCVVFSGECPSDLSDYCEDAQDNDDYSEGWYIHIEDGVATDCDTATDVCDESESLTLTITGNTLTQCDSDGECESGTVELNGNTISYSVNVTGYSEYYPNCSYEVTLSGTRK